jgi:hypothetical protein
MSLGPNDQVTLNLLAAYAVFGNRNKETTIVNNRAIPWQQERIFNRALTVRDDMVPPEETLSCVGWCNFSRICVSTKWY